MVLLEELRTRVAFGSHASTPINAPSSFSSSSEVETIFSCVVGVISKIDEKRFTSLRSWYQIPDELNPWLVVHGEWCCKPCFGVGIYEAYLLGGLRLPLNAFAREILFRLGVGISQLNPHAWRLIVSMQVLWREVFNGNCSLTVDEFLYCYKPSEISQSQGFYQFTARGLNYRLVKSLSTSDGNWKTEFFFITRIWVGNPVVVGRDPFPPYIGEMGNLHPEGISLFYFSFYIFCCSRNLFFFFLIFFNNWKTTFSKKILPWACPTSLFVYR